MPGASKVILIAVSALVFGRPIVALASPVADADLRGKTICWSYGGTRNTYGKDGSFNSNLSRPRHMEFGRRQADRRRRPRRIHLHYFQGRRNVSHVWQESRLVAGWTSPEATANEPPWPSVRRRRAGHMRRQPALGTIGDDNAGRAGSHPRTSSKLSVQSSSANHSFFRWGAFQISPRTLSRPPASNAFRSFLAPLPLRGRCHSAFKTRMGVPSKKASAFSMLRG